MQRADKLASHFMRRSYDYEERLSSYNLISKMAMSFAGTERCKDYISLLYIV